MHDSYNQKRLKKGLQAGRSNTIHKAIKSGLCQWSSGQGTTSPIRPLLQVVSSLSVCCLHLWCKTVNKRQTANTKKRIDVLYIRRDCDIILSRFSVIKS